MGRKTVSTPGAPAAIGPYSQAVRAGGFVFVSGQLPLDPATGKLVAGGIAAQTDAALRGAGRILEAAGSGLHRAVRVTVYLADLASFEEMNGVYAGFFAESPPARSTVQVSGLPKGAGVLVEVTALEGKA